jgi:hypothetical protein
LKKSHLIKLDEDIDTLTSFENRLKDIKICGYDDGVQECIRYYLGLTMVTFAVVEAKDGIDEELLKNLTYVLTDIKYSNNPQLGDSHHIEHNTIVTFFKDLSSKTIREKYDMLDKINALKRTSAYGKQHPIVSMLENQLFRLNFPFEELKKIFERKKAEIVLPAAVKRMIDHFEFFKKIEGGNKGDENVDNVNNI